MKKIVVIIFLLGIFSLDAMEPEKKSAEQLQSLLTQKLPAELQVDILERILKNPFPQQNIQNFLKNFLNVIISLDPAFFPQEVKKQYLNAFAKQWYLTYEKELKIPELWTKRHFKGQTPEKILDWGFSIAELQKAGKLPQIKVGKLDLKYLKINSLQGLQDIPNIAKISELNLAFNRMNTIPPNAFAGLQNLTDLDLPGNQISTIQENAFKGLNNLQWLNLGGNQISTVLTYIFEGLSNLKTLWITNNKISYLPAKAFGKLNNLKWLKLSQNQINRISINAFVGLQNLTDLDLSENQINRIPINIARRTPINVFAELNNLESLNLSKNQINKIPANAFVGLNKLKLLDLRNNLLSETTEERLRKKFGDRVKFIDLSFKKEIKRNQRKLRCPLPSPPKGGELP